MPPPLLITSAEPDPDIRRFVDLIKVMLLRAVSVLSDRDRLRLGCYYRQDLTLAQTGRLLGEHEATVSRQLARSRKAIRAEVERLLAAEAHLTEAEIARCFKCTIEDPGSWTSPSSSARLAAARIRARDVLSRRSAAARARRVAAERPFDELRVALSDVEGRE